MSHLFAAPGRVREDQVWMILAGVVAHALGTAAAIWTVAILTAASGLVVAVRMYETHMPGERSARPRHAPHPLT